MINWYESIIFFFSIIGLIIPFVILIYNMYKFLNQSKKVGKK